MFPTVSSVVLLSMYNRRIFVIIYVLLRIFPGNDTPTSMCMELTNNSKCYQWTGFIWSKCRKYAHHI